MRDPHGRLRLVVGSIVPVLLASGCSTPPPPEPLRAPALATEVRHFAGSPISGARILARDSAVMAAGLEDAWGVRGTFYALETLPSTELELLGPRVALITTARGDEPFSAVPRLQIRGQMGKLPDARAFIDALVREEYGRSAPVAKLAATVLPGVTTVFRLSDWNLAHTGATAGEVCLWRPPAKATAAAGAAPPEDAGAELQLTLVLEGYALPAPGESEPETAGPVDPDETDRAAAPDTAETAARPPPPAPIFQRQQAILLPFPLSEASTLGLFLHLPAPFASSPARALAVVLEISRPAEWDEEERVLFASLYERARENVAKSSLLVLERSGSASAGSLVWAGLSSALRELPTASDRRAVLVYLSHAAGASLAEDIALSASDDLVERMVERLRAATAERRPKNPDELAWSLAQMSYRVLAEELAGRESRPTVEALLTLHAGELGRNAPVLEEVLAASRSAGDLEKRLVEENLNYLEDTSPASRARAFRWLQARGAAPEGYDPLAPTRERRAALSRAAEKAERALEGGASSPPALEGGASSPPASPTGRASGEAVR